MWKLILPLLFLACNSDHKNILGADSAPLVGQYTTNSVGDFRWAAYKDKPHFSFPLKAVCDSIASGGTVAINNSDSAFASAVRWRAWAQVGSDNDFNAIHTNLPIKKGPHGWEPSCEDVNPDAKGVVVWE